MVHGARRILTGMAIASAVTVLAAWALLLGGDSIESTEAPRRVTVFVAVDGNNANPGTRALPVRTFARAYRVAAPGATVLVGAGVYPSQEISEDPAKASATPVVFQPSGGAVTVAGTLDFGQGQFGRRGPKGVTVRNMKVEVIRAWDGTDGLVWDNIDALRFDASGKNITIRGSDFGPCQAPRDGDSACVSRIAGPATANVVLEDSSVHEVTSTDPVNYHVDGLAIFGGENILIRRNRFYGNHVTNIRVQNCCGNLPIRNLTLENNWFGVPLQANGLPRTDGINLDSSIPGLVIRFNSFAEGTGPWFAAAQPDTVFTGNLFQNGSCAAGVTYSYNVFIPFSEWSGVEPCGPTDKKASTFGYVNPAGFDFHIRGDSPAVGASSGSKCVHDDIDRQSRVLRCDAGADQFQS